MGSICDKVTDRMRDEMHKNDPPRCKHGQMLCYGCWHCKTDERLDRIEQALSDAGLINHRDGGAE